MKVRSVARSAPPQRPKYVRTDHLQQALGTASRPVPTDFTTSRLCPANFTQEENSHGCQTDLAGPHPRRAAPYPSLPFFPFDKLRTGDERSQSGLGYLLQVEGSIGNEEQVFTVGIGPVAQAKHSFQVGDGVQGECLPPDEPRSEPAEFYKVSKLKPMGRPQAEPSTPPPWTGALPSLEVYRERGFRRLAARTYDSDCGGCIWSCRMAVEIIVDHWNPSVRRYRTETFCYGPKSCPSYKPGPTRKVPGRQGMI